MSSNNPRTREKRIKTLSQAEEQFNLVRTTDPAFFTEWQENLPDLTDAEKAVLDRVKSRYRYHRAKGNLAEGVVKLVVLAPFLELADFYDPPFEIKGEVPVEISVSMATGEDSEETLRGRVDFLVVSQQLWVLLLESKGTEINLELAIPQILTYMMANPDPNNPIFGMATNGGSFFFLKCDRAGTPQYDISRVFSHLPLQNELYEVLRILKKLGTSFINVRDNSLN